MLDGYLFSQLKEDKSEILLYAPEKHNVTLGPSASFAKSSIRSLDEN